MFIILPAALGALGSGSPVPRPLEVEEEEGCKAMMVKVERGGEDEDVIWE